MKKFCAVLLLIAVSSLLFLSCTKDLENSIILKNEAGGDIYFNFRGKIVTVQPGKTVNINAIPIGLYTYSTTYEVPASATSSSASGDASGQIEIKPATKFLIFYSSTFIDNTYSLFATSSNSDDQTIDETPTGF